MGRRLIALVVALAIAAALFWRLSSERERGSPPPASPARAAEAAPAPRPEAEERVAAPERVGVEPQEAEAHTTQEAAASPAPEPERADLAARDWLEILVLDPDEHPVFDAELSIDGVRKEGDRGSWYSMRDPATARTDAQGRARISYARWVDIDGRTIEVDLEVKHPEFVAFRDSSFPIGPGQHPVRLQRGSTVVVSAWYGEPERVVTDVTIRADRDSQLPASAWTRERDGRLATTQLSPGRHLLWIKHESEELGSLSSAIEDFVLAENEWKELHVELHALETLQGRLDDAVPRPIVDGHVGVNLHHSGGDPAISRDFEAPVREDGTFELPGLPRARGQIIALCRGWVSRRTRADTAAEAGIRFGHEPSAAEIERALERAGDRAYQAQRIAVPSPAPLVVLMEPTGTLDVTVATQDGTPVAGAVVSAWPNVYWIDIGSTIFPWREWNGITDSTGRARIEDLPPDDSLLLGVTHASFRMTLAARNETPRVAIGSARVAELRIVLEPSQD